MTFTNSRTGWLASSMALASAMGLALAGCTKKEDDGNLMVMHEQLKDEVKTFDPANAYDNISLRVAPSILDTLYQYDYLSASYKLIPLLAADMPKISADRLTYTIPIKHGVKFQDDPCFAESAGKGRELKAQDFITGWKRLALPGLQSQGWWIFDGKVVGINAFHDKLNNAPKDQVSKAFEESVEGFKALDDYTIQIKLVKPYPQLMYVLAMTFTAPVPKEAIAKYADPQGNLTDHPVGTGPYVLKSWERGRRLVFDRNPNYHPEFYPTEGSVEFRKQGLLADAGKPLPFIDRIYFDVSRETQPRWLGMMSGSNDLLEIPKDNFNQALVKDANGMTVSPELATKGIKLAVDTSSAFRYLTFNTTDKFLSNKYLRQALSSAIDREKWIELFTGGTAKKMVTALPPGVQDRVQDGRIKYDYDLARAKELLKKAGHPDGQGLPTINFDLRGADTMNRQIGDFVQQQWAKIGVKTNVTANTFPAFLEKMKQGQLQASYGGWSMDYPDGENVYQLAYGPNKTPGPNDANYDNPEANKLFEQIAAMESGPKRAALVRKLDDLIQEDVPLAFGYYEAVHYLQQPWLENYRASEIINNKYKYFRINRDVKKQRGH